MIKNAISGRKRLGTFNILILMLNAGTVIALALSYLSAHISPEKSWLLPFFGLLYPYLVLINLFFMVYWMVRRRWLFLLPAIIILAGWNHLDRTIQFFSPGSVPVSESQFKLMTYNVKNLSNDNVDLLEPDIRDKIIGFLASEDPDLLCLQEFAVIHPNPEAFIDTLAERLNMPYHTHSHYTKKSRRGIDAIIVFSKFPILNHGSVKGADLHNYAMYADLQNGNDTIRLYNVHLESFRFRHEDYNFISELDLQFEENENLKAGSMRIFKKIKTAFSKRASQVDTLVSRIKNSPYPVILCGDFNDTPNSYTYQKLSANLTDSFIESGIGLGNTYIGNLPSYRIDHILYDDYFTSTRCRRGLVKYSDHYPVSCIIDVRKNDE